MTGIDLKLGEAIHVRYTNWRGETAPRHLYPVKIWFGSTEWHTEPQWLVKASDLTTGNIRDFALKDMVPVEFEGGKA